jgi:2-C-methyl-D-erythritol 4-phosphate cytidylyltransferase
MKNIALIVAGGQGSRVKSAVPKQFLELHHKPVLMHAIEKFRRSCNTIIVVLPESQIAFWEKLCAMHHFAIPHQLVKGGETRLHSVYNGLKEIKEECLVAIHDGVRPLVDEKIIAESFRVAAEKGNAVASVKLKDSIREMRSGKNFAIARENYVLLQTPQTFNSKAIREAYQKLFQAGIALGNFTDDAMVAEYSGAEITLIEGSYSNLKITVPEDLIIASALMSKE